MSIFSIRLTQFCLYVPTFVEATTLASMIDFLTQLKTASGFDWPNVGDVVVLDRFGCPAGLLRPSEILPKLLVNLSTPNSSVDSNLDWQKSIGQLMGDYLEPLIVLPATMEFEDLSEWLKSNFRLQRTSRHECALVDGEGKFLGLLDWWGLISVLPQIDADKQVGTASFPELVSQGEAWEREPLIQLLERLPWPLVLETDTGEVIAQNQAWWQQLGGLKDYQGIHENVEGIFQHMHSLQANLRTRQYTQNIANTGNTSNSKNHEIFLESSPQTEKVAVETLITQNIPQSSFSHHESQEIDTLFTTEKLPGRCTFDQRMGTCTCVVDTENGQERVWQFAKIPLGKLNRHSGASATLWLMLATDVTEQQLLCQELAAKNADLIQLNRLKDEFLACISHELKTPLTAVLGLSRLLVDQNLGELNERQARYAGLIHQSGRHLMSVVNDILDLTRMETGQMELTLGVVDIRQACDRAINEAKKNYLATSKNLDSGLEHQITLKIEPELVSMVADDLRLRQMLLHLLSNAFKFTEPGKEVGLRVMRWEGWVAFTVWDTGIGIPEHQQHLIFQKFQQLENPLTRQFEGTGLGLVLTRALARLHGGDVSFISNEGKGSQFTLLLPPSPPNTGLNDQSANDFFNSNISNGRENTALSGLGSHPSHPNPLSVANLSSTSSRRLVLLVEAVGRYIEDLSEQLTGLGYRVAIARSGCEALEKARRLQPGIIFLNPLLPLLSGWDVLTLVKADAATRKIPIIITGTSADKDQAFSNRADGFLNLPVASSQLQPLLKKINEVTPDEALLQCVEASPLSQPLKILRLVPPNLEASIHPILPYHRVIEVDNLEQAEIMARVWQFNVMLLDAPTITAMPFLQELSQHPRLIKLPLVTCTLETTQAASQIPGMGVFPCHALFNAENRHPHTVNHALASVLQIAAGNCCPPSLLVVDLMRLPDLPKSRLRNRHKTAKASSSEAQETRNEWLQALVQYFQTAGLKAATGRSWGELIQQLRHHSVDLVLIYLGDYATESAIKAAFQALEQISFSLPILIVWDRRHSSIVPDHLNQITKAIATQILPRSISMEELLNQVHQVLK